VIAPVVALVRREPAVSLFLAVSTAVSIVVGLVRGQAFLWIYLPLLVACVVIVGYIDQTRGPIPGFLLWLLAVWAVMHLAGGLAANPTGNTRILYGMWIIDGALRYDQVVHGFGIATATAVFVTAARTTGSPLLWGFFWGQMIGIGNEAVENVFSRFVANSNVGDAVNTAWDLGWHLIGGTIAILVIARRGIPTVQEVAR
jgi:hypothetical protein